MSAQAAAFLKCSACHENNARGILVAMLHCVKDAEDLVRREITAHRQEHGLKRDPKPPRVSGYVKDNDRNVWRAVR